MRIISRKLKNTPIFPYAISLYPDEGVTTDYEEIRAWCKKTFGEESHPSNPNGRWHREYLCFRFNNEVDVNWFLLRWSA